MKLGLGWGKNQTGLSEPVQACSINKGGAVFLSHFAFLFLSLLLS